MREIRVERRFLKEDLMVVMVVMVVMVDRDGGDGGP